MGLDILLRAWHEVQARRPDAVLLVAGEGRERVRLEALRARLPYPDGVRFVGQVTDDELTVLYQAADVSVVPTRALEGFGLVTLESMACGTPPIVTDVGGLPDGVVGLDPTLVVPAEDPEALAARILAAAEGHAPSPPACRAHAETFSWAEVARRHLELYRRATGERPIRVAYLGHTAALSGGELALARLLPALTGVEPLVLLGEGGPLVARLAAGGASIEVVPMAERARGLRKEAVGARRLPVRSALAAIRYSLRLALRLRRLRPDLVHTNTLKAALYGGVAGRLAGVPVVWHVRDRIAPDYLPRPAVGLVRVAARVLPTMVIANSEATLATLGRGRRRSTVVVHDAASPSGARSDPSPDRSFTVGLVGRLAPWKGQDVFLRAFAMAFPNGDERARIAGSALFGEDDWAAALPTLAAELGIADRVEVVGFVDDMTAEYGRIDVLVHASTIPEPFGQVVVEGMAAGLAVVAAAAGGPAEVITDGVDGLLYPMGDVEALADRLRRLASDPVLRAGLGDAGRSRAAEFTPERIAAQVEDVYRALIAARRRSWSGRRRAPRHPAGTEAARPLPQ
jgi:glycosyltransferase involved in cell wall biosynthesis